MDYSLCMSCCFCRRWNCIGSCYSSIPWCWPKNLILDWRMFNVLLVDVWYLHWYFSSITAEEVPSQGEHFCSFFLDLFSMYFLLLNSHNKSIFTFFNWDHWEYNRTFLLLLILPRWSNLHIPPSQSFCLISLYICSNYPFSRHGICYCEC